MIAVVGGELCHSDRLSSVPPADSVVLALLYRLNTRRNAIGCSVTAQVFALSANAMRCGASEVSACFVCVTIGLFSLCAAFHFRLLRICFTSRLYTIAYSTARKEYIQLALVHA